MYRNVTMISDLPELSELEGGNRNQFDHQGFANHDGMPEEKMQKYLRTSPTVNPMSGMIANRPPVQERYTQEKPQAGTYAQYGEPGRGYDMRSDGAGNIVQMPQPVMQPVIQQEMYIPPVKDIAQQLNCIDVANHIQSCPICSKFYHNDRSLYIITIAVLCIICILLLKRVLNV